MANLLNMLIENAAVQCVHRTTDSLYFHFNGRFPGEPGLAGVY